MTFKTYSKVNYTLEVGQKKSDGFHPLKSIVQTLDLYDEITIERNKKFSLTCSDISVPCNENNTVWKACSLFFDKFKIKDKVSIHIEKHIPTQAGMGGGSSNASGVILALNNIFETHLDKKEMSDLSAQIGSDCPLFIYGGTCLMEGRGEIITPLKPFPKVYFLIIKPNFSVSTKEAYAKLDLRKNIISKHFTEQLIEFQKEGNLTIENLCAYMTNDFEILNKLDIFDGKMTLMNAGAKGALLSGSGSCIFGVFSTENDRDNAYNKLHPYYKLYKATSI